MLEAIRNNPFRVLGVCGNAPLKDIVANRNRINAFAKVGKPCPLPLDFEPLIGPVDRTPASVQKADSALTIERDRLLAAQFWFMKQDAIDEQALRFLSAGDTAGAMRVLCRHDSASSLQNRAVISLITGNVAEAAKACSRLTASFATQFVEAAGVSPDLAPTLAENFIKEIISGDPSVTAAMLTGPGFSKEWNDAVAETMARPLITQLEDALTEARKSRGEGALARLSAGRRLASEADGPLGRLKSMMPDGNLKVVNIADKVANEILQCGIDYYNDSDNVAAARDSLSLASRASAIAMGSMVRQRISENVRILKDNLSSVPPTEISAETAAVSEAIRRYRETKPDIAAAGRLYASAYDDLRAIAGKVGENSPFYINPSTAVVQNVLNGIIDEVNYLQAKFNEAPQGSALERGFYERYCAAVRASKVQLDMLGSMGMDSECRARYNSNLATLNSLLSQINASGYTTTTTGTGTAGDSGSKFGGCLVQILVYLGIMGLVALCR